MYEVGETTDEIGQPILEANLVRMLPEVVDWQRSQPTAIIEFHPWLLPTRIATDSVAERVSKG